MRKDQKRMKDRPKFPIWKMIVTVSSMISITPFLIYDGKYKVNASENQQPVDPLNPEVEVTPIPPDKKTKEELETVNLFLDGVRLPDGQVSIAISNENIEPEKEHIQGLTISEKQSHQIPPWLEQLNDSPLVLPDDNSGGGPDGLPAELEDSFLGEVYGSLCGSMLVGVAYINEEEEVILE